MTKLKIPINKNHLEFIHDSDTFIKFGKDVWIGEPVENIWYLAWKPNKNPYSNDEYSNTRLMGYICFTDSSSFISYSYLKYQYRGKGLGEFLYNGVTEKEGFLSTNLSYASHYATKLWEKLEKNNTSKKLYVDDSYGIRIYR